MLFHIRHTLHYAYERPVFLEPTTLRLIPRSDPAQQLLHHQLRIQPDPSGSSRVLEPDGGEAMVLWLSGLQQQLRVEAEMVVRTTRDNPFGWIVTHGPAAQLVPRQPPWPFRDNQVGRWEGAWGCQVVAGDNLGAATPTVSHPATRSPISTGVR